MATQAQVSTELARRLVNKYLAALTFADVSTAFQNATQQEKDALVNGIKKRSDTQMGRAIGSVMRRHILAQAKAEADTIVADNSISLTEFERIYL